MGLLDRRRLAVAGALFVVLLGGCAPYPVEKNRPDFVAAIERGEGWSQVESYEVDRSFVTVTRVLEHVVVPCFSFGHSPYMTNEGAKTTGSTFTAELERRDDKAELTIREIRVPPPIWPRMPKGGFYLIAVDVAPVSASRTKVVVYGPSRGYGKFLRAIRGRLSGTGRGCPAYD